MAENKEKFWMIAIINGSTEMVCNVDNEIIKFSNKKDAFQCAKEHALRLGEKYQCAVMEAMDAEIGKMVTERITYQSVSQTSESI